MIRNAPRNRRKILLPAETSGLAFSGLTTRRLKANRFRSQKRWKPAENGVGSIFVRAPVQIHPSPFPSFRPRYPFLFNFIFRAPVAHHHSRYPLFCLPKPPSPRRFSTWISSPASESGLRITRLGVGHVFARSKVRHDLNVSPRSAAGAPSAIIHSRNEESRR